MAGRGESRPILVHMYATHAGAISNQPERFIDRLNGRYHEFALRSFMVIVLAHWGEHLFQALLPTEQAASPAEFSWSIPAAGQGFFELKMAWPRTCTMARAAQGGWLWSCHPVRRDGF